MATEPSSTVLKAFEVLELFRDRPMLTTTDCSQALGLPRATAHRLLVSLKTIGVVESAPGGHYRLTLALFELGAGAPVRRQLMDRARGPMERLAAETNASVHLGVRREDSLLYLENVHSQPHHVGTRVGQRGPLHATGLGKILLAYAPQSAVEKVIALGLRRFTPATIVYRDILLAQLAEVRDEGVAYDDEESVLGIRCVAAPVRLGDEVVAALSVTAPATRDTRSRHLRTQVLRSVTAIERAEDWNPIPDISPVDSGTRAAPRRSAAG